MMLGEDSCAAFYRYLSGIEVASILTILNIVNKLNSLTPDDVTMVFKADQ